MNLRTPLLSAAGPGALDQAAEILRGGGLVAFPTDTVYGIGVSAFNARAVDRIFQVKGRSLEKAIPILLADADELEQIALQVTGDVKRLIHHFWPGALTLILPKAPHLPANLSATETIGVRIPDLALARDLLRLTGPLAATSANLSGKPSALTAQQVLEQLEGRVDLVLDGGPALGGHASTVVDCSRGVAEILREGPITREQINQLLGYG
jgi:L-threonylcarbamoyladenylate synthase